MNKNYKENQIKDCAVDKVFNALIITLLCCVLILIGYPILIIISSSFSSPSALMAGKVWLFPVQFTFAGYQAVMKHKQIWIGAGNSVFYTVVGTMINMVVTIMAAYPLSRKDFAPRRFLALIFAFTMWFSGGLIPQYLLVRNLGMYNTRWALLIPTAMSVWNMIILRTYFQNNIPDSLFESAKLDGCDDITYLIRIALPISKPVIAVISLYYGVSHWNTFLNAYIYLQSQSLQPLQIVLREILILSQMQEVAVDSSAVQANAQQMSELLKYSLVLVASLPMLVLYFIVQKHFTKGAMVGSIKG